MLVLQKMTTFVGQIFTLTDGAYKRIGNLTTRQRQYERKHNTRAT